MVEFGVKYVRKDSFFHRIDPMTKIIYVLLIGLSIIMTLNLVFEVIFLIITLFVAFFLARVSPSEIFKPIRYIFPVVLGFVFTSPLFIGNTPVFPNSVIPFYYEGLNYGLLLGIRFLIIFTTSFTFVFSTHPRDLVQALTLAGLPYKAAHAFEIAFATLPVMDYETRIISYSQKIRQVGEGKNIFSSNWERARKLLITLFIRGIKHAEILAIAMNSRGYGSHKERSYMDQIERPRSGIIFRYLCLVITIIYVAYVFLGGWQYSPRIRF